jgi:hypothetical protein
MQRHGLIDPHPDVITAVRAMASAHAQVMSAAEVSIGIRTNRTSNDVRQELQDQNLIKMYGLRGTVHLVPAADFGLWTAALDVLTSPPQIKDILTPAQTGAVLDAIADAVSDGPKTAAELDEAVINATGPWAADPVMPNFGGTAPRWRHALGTASRKGIICFGPNRGRNSTFQKAPDTTTSSNHDPVNWLLTTYLHAYGPATADQFARWTAGPKPRARQAFEQADLETTEHGFINRGDSDWPDEAATVRMLPYFDAYTVGCHPRDLLFPINRDRVAPGGSAGNFPVILVDGAVAGIWHQRKSGRRLQMTVEAFQDLDRDQIVAQAERIAAISDSQASVAFDRVAVTSHR